MTILSANETWRGQTAEDEESGARSYEAHYIIVSDSPTESPISVKAILPDKGASYPGDAEAKVRSRSVSRRDDTREVWDGVVRYERDPEEDEEEEESPLDEPAKIKWTSSLENEAAFKDANDEAIVNSAGDYFDPPVEWPVAKWQATVQKNVASIPGAILSWAGAINETAYTIDGITVEAKKSRLIAIDKGDRQEKNDIGYYVFSMTIEFDDEEYKIRPLDQGYRYKEGTTLKDILITGEDGSEERPSAPVLLDGAGAVLADPSPENAVFLEFDPPKTPVIDFSVLPLT